VAVSNGHDVRITNDAFVGGTAWRIAAGNDRLADYSPKGNKAGGVDSNGAYYNGASNTTARRLDMDDPV
jgi:hypothetical protein